MKLLTAALVLSVGCVVSDPIDSIESTGGARSTQGGGGEGAATSTDAGRAFLLSSWG